ncbi:CinA family protein [Corynebacterium auriscanis]|uniref:CinA family protein n=1 Tax=Corynebacterium auriscanis TaxID=99807 RepID=UPI002246312B|nr:CinA family protein [Corynebacterium auriscanis]MCX2163001.1 CinA family protein [Corynebacterium auriscanis]
MPAQQNPCGYTPITINRPPQQPQQVVAQLRASGRTIATAESLTAGLVSATIATVPGASIILRGGLIVYATDLKARLAGVDQRYLRRHGPIDPGVAAALARGAATACDADLGIGLTGVAGPDPQDGHPVGEVYVGVGTKEGNGTAVAKLPASWWDPQADDVRASIRQAAVSLALTLLSIVDSELS